MPIKVSCACGKKLSVKDEHAGKRLKCPACQKPLRIPRPKVEEESLDDEWDSDDEDDYDDEQAEAPVRSRRARPSRARRSCRGNARAKARNRPARIAD
jgi:DNA-directed RNA polymerase subunit M/transcription elongation factor TFIIS